MIELKGIKVVSAKILAAMEAKAFAEGIKEDVLMQKAGEHVAEFTIQYVQERNLKKHVTLLIGKGNNGADAYVAGQLLLKKGYSVHSLHVFSFEESTPLNRLHCDRFRKEGGHVEFISSEKNVKIEKKSLIIDGLLGTGFSGEIIKSVLLSVIKMANKSFLPIISIDIPSGLDGNTGKCSSSGAIEADVTVCFSLPKIGFFLEDGWNYVGKLICVDIGLPKKYLDQIKTDYYLPDETNLEKALPKIKRNRHKYEAGYLIGIAGSKGLSGAAKLSALAALRSGAGIVKLVVPSKDCQEMFNLPYEIIHDNLSENNIDEIKEACQKARALFIGPGIGRNEKTFSLIKQILTKIDKPLVLDADALFFLAKDKQNIPKKSILTPHRKEMLRLLGWEKMQAEQTFLHACKEFADQYQICLVVKGAPTFIFQPSQPTFILYQSDPGMATAGSGDVLTGIIAALLSQQIPVHLAAILGVYLQGIAGERAAKEKTSYSMIASDIIKHLPHAFKKIGA